MVLVQNRVVCGFPRGNSGLSCCTLCSSGRGLRRDTRGYYQGVGTPGGLAGIVLPLSKCLVHRDSEDTLGYLEVEVFPPQLV
jgi:hypothetical protein